MANKILLLVLLNLVFDDIFWAQIAFFRNDTQLLKQFKNASHKYGTRESTHMEILTLIFSFFFLFFWLDEVYWTSKYE